MKEAIKKNGLLLAIVILLMPLSAWSQRYNFKIYSVNEGLPHAQVHDIHQAGDGFIWMATSGGGLSRFDGNSFTTYTTDDGLRNNSVQQVFEDSGGRLWVANLPGGVMRFRADSLYNPFPDDSLSHFEVYQIKEMNKGEIWFGTYRGGVFIYEDGGLKRLTKSDGLPSNSVWDFWKAGDGSIWMGTQEGISVYKNGHFTNYTVEDGLSGRKVYRITRDRDGNLWFATSDGLTIWDGETFTAVKEINGITLNYIFDVATASDGKIWIATEAKGLFVYEDGKYRHFTRENGLSSNYIYEFYEDRDRNMWIATDENGVNLYRGDAFAFYDEEVGLTTNEVLSVFIDRQGTRWFATTEGIQSYDGEKVRQYPLPGSYENEHIWEMEELPNGNMLFLMPDQTLMEYDGRRFYNFTEKHGLEKWFTYDLYVDSKQVLWISTDEGLYRLEGDKRDHYTIHDGMAGNVVQTVREGPDGSLYIGTRDGLSIYDGSSFTNISFSEGLSNDEINFITFDEDRYIWLGTGGGVSVVKPQEDDSTYTVENFGKDAGMNLVETHAIWFDEEGHLWQSTNGGLNRLDVPTYRKTGTMELVHYALSERGLGTEFNFRALAVDQHGNAWFGSMDGALKLDISRLKQTESESPAAVHITDMLRNSKAVEWKNYTDSIQYRGGRMLFPEVQFPYGEDSYTFSFVGLNYENPEDVQYRYRLKGFEEDWMPLTTANTATYTSLNPGNYSFEVQARSGTRKTYTKAASYSFSIDNPFWRTYWFFALVLLAAGSLVYGYIRMRLGMLEKRRLKELVDEQTEHLQKALAEKEVLIKEIHHRVKNNLAVISGLLDLQRGYTEDPFASKILGESQRRIQSISMIHEKLYQNERLAAIDIKKYIEELVDIIRYSFNHAGKNIDVELNVDDIKLGIDQGIPCGLILHELLSNAYEHAFKDASEGTIELNFRQVEGSTICFSVEDDGWGLPDKSEKQFKSLGLTLVRTLAQQLEARYEIERLDQGTRFVIEFEQRQAPLQVPIDT